MRSKLFQQIWRTVVLGLAVLILSASAVMAQSIVDARRVEFTPSTDHAGLDPDGTPLVTNYSLQVVLAGGTAAVQTVNLGKPAPGTDGMIRLDFVALLPVPLTLGVSYEALVSAVGPGGTSAPTRSNAFSFAPTCGTPSISPAGQSVAATAGSGSSTVTTAAGCAWTAASNNGWISLTSGASGSGTGTVGFSFSANTATTSRTGSLTIAGSTFTLTQAGASCTYSISSTSQSVAAAGGTGSVTVTTGNGCAWNATSAASWVTITSGASGSGGGSAGFTVAANTTSSSRSATLTIAGNTFSVTQAGACAFTVSPAALTLGATGATGTITVTTSASCAWTASSPASWISVTGSGSASGSATYTVSANATTAVRTTTLTIAGKSVSVTQGVLTLPPSAPSNVRIVR